MAPNRRGLTSAAVAALVMLGLVGCAPGALDSDSDPQPSSSAPATTGSPAPTGSPVPSGSTPPDPEPSSFEPTPSTAPTTGPVVGDLDLACTEVLTPDQVYALNPELLPTAEPAGGVPGGFADIADAGGLVCAWQHVTSGDVLLVGVLDATEDGADGDVDANGLPARRDTVGDWSITVASEYFEGADAEADALIQTVGGNLP